MPAAISTYHPTEIEVWNATATNANGGYADITLAPSGCTSPELRVDAHEPCL